LPDRFSSLELLQFVVMPNHVHGLLSIAGAVLAPPGVSTSAMLTGSQGGGVSLFGIMRAFKSISARQVNQTLRTNGRALWQRGCYEHVVRDGEDFGNVQRYILENPAKWELDQENPRIQIRSTGMDG
jgi:REP element-mobilizing transposase RayT